MLRAAHHLSRMRARLLLSCTAVMALCAVGMFGPTGSPLMTVASARPLISAPPQMLNQARQPCVLYSCATNPRLHLDYQRSLPGARYCQLYPCSPPMDLVPNNGFDDNLFPLNPDWAYFVETGQPPDANRLCNEFKYVGGSPLGSPPCTSQPVDRDGAGGATNRICARGRKPHSAYHGHVNFEPATYEGSLAWDTHSNSVYDDDDYGLQLHTVNAHGATAANPPGTIHLEFNSDETIDNFDNSPWWKRFHSAVDGSDARARQVIDGHLAEVTGLVGLDTAHTPAAESHPVYAMAIRTFRKVATSGVLAGKDQWSFFARSWGDEGYCSQHNHTLPPGRLTVRIPWLVGRRGTSAVPEPASGVKIVGIDDVWRTVSSGVTEISVLKGEGVLLTFDLSAPTSKHPLYFGTIGLQWTFAPPPTSRSTAASAPPVTPRNSARAARSRKNPDIEVQVERLWKRLPQRVRSTARALLRRPRLTLPKRRLRPRMIEPPLSPQRAMDAFVAPRLDPRVIARSTAQGRALCRAYKNRVPGYPGICPHARRK